MGLDYYATLGLTRCARTRTLFGRPLFAALFGAGPH